MPNLMDSAPIIKDRTRYEQPLPLNLSVPHFDNSLKYRLTKLKDYINSYINVKEILICNKGMQQSQLHLHLNKNFFFQSHCKYLHVHFFHDFNTNNNASHLLILQT